MTDIVNELLSKGVDVNECLGAPLTNAVINGNMNVFKLFLESGAKVDGPGPLYSAIQSHNYEIIDMLLQAGSPVNYNNDETSALAFAVGSGDVKIVRTLLKYGADPNAKCNAWGVTSILGLALYLKENNQTSKELENIIELLLDYEAKLA